MSIFFSPSLAFTPGQNSIIDHKPGIMTNYIDDVDRFFHHHRFIHCFSPRFDLEEHTRFYLLTGDVPGGKAEDITIEPRDERTLVISGNINRSTRDSEERAKFDAKSEKAEPIQETPEVDTQQPDDTSKAPNQPTSPTSRARFQLHISSLTHLHGGKSVGSQAETSVRNGGHGSEYTMLLNERMGTGGTRFSRTFTLPMPIDEDAIQASVEDGILRVLVPKKEEHLRKPKKNVQVVQL